MKRLIYICCICFLSFQMMGQDAHFSQYQNHPVYLNPASTGVFDSTYQFRAGGIYRNQWSALTQGFNSYGAFLDGRAGELAWGLQFTQNDAGDASLQHTYAGFSLALHKRLGDGRNLLIAGGQVGFIQKRFDPDALVFDSQFNNGTIDPTSGESFANTSKMMPDINVGVQYLFQISELDQIDGVIGVSFAHLTRPKSSFFNDETIRYPMRTSVNVGINYQINALWSMHPRVLYQSHGPAKEMLVGSGFGYQLDRDKRLKGGLDYRFGDAFIVSAGADIKNVTLGLAYDMNVSKLATFTNGFGAIELSAIFHLGQGKSLNKREKVAKDRDGDGIIDRHDDCPYVPGVPRLSGCPEITSEQAVMEPEPEVRPPSIPTRKEEDSDGDGIIDAVDLCPFEFGLIKFQGCNDSDIDGVWDHVDACPHIRGSVENNGCPTRRMNLDSDGDGVLDPDDVCVYVKGKPELKGCPDTDNDGVSDLEDECPYIRGIFTNKGCPDAGMQSRNLNYGTQPMDMTRRVDLQVVEFDIDRSDIRPYYFAMLDQLAMQLMNNPNQRIMLSGHTDSEGSAAYNYQLGQRRAQAIQQYLLTRGVPMHKIQIMSYGETIPKSNNASMDGKQRNRRTEITVLSQ
ncbi:MAG: PorP/SprF family type IX secretion system membrane protein [Bacteroidota bacterium]